MHARGLGPRGTPERLAYNDALGVAFRPSDGVGVPQFDRGDTAVYDPHVLLRSWLALQGRTILAVPGDVETLIEEVYGDYMRAEDQTPGIQEIWRATEKEMDAKRQRHEATARPLMVLPPIHPDDIFEGFNRELDEDNTEIHESLRAQTRLSDPTVEVVILPRDRAENLLPPYASEDSRFRRAPTSARVSPRLPLSPLTVPPPMSALCGRSPTRSGGAGIFPLWAAAPPRADRDAAPTWVQSPAFPPRPQVGPLPLQPVAAVTPRAGPGRGPASRNPVSVAAPTLTGGGLAPTIPRHGPLDACGGPGPM
ncbi:MAG: hypothetical protein ABIH46_04890 [Chloroflexota bacterium]